MTRPHPHTRGKLADRIATAIFTGTVSGAASALVTWLLATHLHG
jgi:hypothetical protein